MALLLLAGLLFGTSPALAYDYWIVGYSSLYDDGNYMVGEVYAGLYYYSWCPGSWQYNSACVSKYEVQAEAYLYEDGVLVSSEISSIVESGWAYKMVHHDMSSGEIHWDILGQYTAGVYYKYYDFDPDTEFYDWLWGAGWDDMITNH
jgi:hypothetical protein